jgi:hypothetical protein
VAGRCGLRSRATRVRCKRARTITRDRAGAASVKSRGPLRWKASRAGAGRRLKQATGCNGSDVAGERTRSGESRGECREGASWRCDLRPRHQRGRRSVSSLSVSLLQPNGAGSMQPTRASQPKKSSTRAAPKGRAGAVPENIRDTSRRRNIGANRCSAARDHHRCRCARRATRRKRRDVRGSPFANAEDGKQPA